jgi:hypothetical protein
MEEIIVENIPTVTIYEEREYLILSVAEISLIDFSAIEETSADTLRKSVDETKTVIKWEGVPPTFVESLTSKEGPYTYDEILVIMNTLEWTEPFVE